MRERSKELGIWWDEENGFAREISIGRSEQPQPEHHFLAALRLPINTLVLFGIYPSTAILILNTQ